MLCRHALLRMTKPRILDPRFSAAEIHGRPITLFLPDKLRRDAIFRVEDAHKSGYVCKLEEVLASPNGVATMISLYLDQDAYDHIQVVNNEYHLHLNTPEELERILAICTPEMLRTTKPPF